MTPSTQPMFTEEEIRRKVDELATLIAEDLGDGSSLMVIGLLRGCFMYLSDLVRALQKHGVKIEEIDFMITSSYGSGTVSSRNVKIERDLRSDIAGRNVLVVDDILDTGHTMRKVIDLLRSRMPKWLKTTTILDKPSRREVEMVVDYVGFEIDNVFVIGYGLDYNQHYRDLPYITCMID